MKQVQKVHLSYTGDASYFTANPPTFPSSLQFTDSIYGTLTTTAISDARVPSQVEDALRGLPNHVVPEVTVESDNANSDAQNTVFHVTFSHAGAVNLLGCPSPYGCREKGCHPKYDPVVRDFPTDDFFVFEAADAQYLSMANGTPNPSEWDVVVVIECNTGSGFDCSYEAFTNDGGFAVITSGTPMEVDHDEKITLPYGLKLKFDSTNYPGTAGSTTLRYKWSFPRCTVSEVRPSDEVFEHVECGNRGVCDRGVGKCNCFSGYAGLACDRRLLLA